MTLAAFDLGETGKAETLAAAAGGFCIGIGELQATVDQVVGVVNDQTVQKLQTRSI